MPIEITIPRLGWSMDEANFVGWLKQDGEPVTCGEPLFTLESEKASQDIDATGSGILRVPKDGPKPGQVVKLGQVIGHLVAENEFHEFEALPSTGSPTQVETAHESKRRRLNATDIVSERSPFNEPTVGQCVPPALPLETLEEGRRDALPYAAAAAEANPSPHPSLAGRGSETPMRAQMRPIAGSQIAVKDPVTRNEEGPQMVTGAAISPRARRLAAQLQMDTTRLRGSGRKGRIIEIDVREAAKNR